MTSGTIVSWGSLRIGGADYDVSGMQLFASGQAGKPSREYFNARRHLITPTYDGSGCTVHPDVVDMLTMHGISEWNGYRFWMAHTPYFQNITELENPSILASQDGVRWVTPAGLTNPIYPGGTVLYNSDTDLVYDPVTDELVLFFRIDGAAGRLRTMRSANGTTWTGPTELPGWVGVGETVSPAVVRMGDGSWAMWGIQSPERVVRKWTAPSPLGPWGASEVCTGMSPHSWHLDATRIGGKLYAVVDVGGQLSTSDPHDGIHLTSSVDDGLTWAWRAAPAIIPGYSWDSGKLYRATLQPHEDEVSMRVWYGGQMHDGPSATPATSWHVGLAQIPLDEWP